MLPRKDPRVSLSPSNSDLTIFAIYVCCHIVQWELGALFIAAEILQLTKEKKVGCNTVQICRKKAEKDEIVTEVQ